MSIKAVKTRVQNKHDIPANWEKAINFIPLAGELIIYDDHYFDAEGNKIIVADCIKYKIGDGVVQADGSILGTKLNDLPFVESTPDQSYNEDSTRAQSGTAVAEAIDELSTDIQEEIAPLTDEAIDNLWAATPGTGETPTFSMTDGYIPVWNGATFEDGVAIDTLAASAVNMEKGTGARSVQQLCREDKVSVQDGEVDPHFTFSGHIDSPYNGTRVKFGAVGDHSVSLGGRSASLGKCSITLNNQTIASNENACALGYSTTATGACAIAGGTNTLATEEGAVSLGMMTKATAPYALSTGSQTEASGDCAIAGGKDSIASAFYSQSHGLGTIADQTCQTVVGKYNGAQKDSLFTVGCGTDAEHRDSAFHVLANRAIIIYGVKSDEASGAAEPVCLQDVLNFIEYRVDGLADQNSSLFIVDQNLQRQIYALQNEIQSLRAQISALQAK